MRESIRKLTTICTEEINGQYDNDTVDGGLESYLAHWRRAAQNEGLTEPFIAQITSVLNGYGHMAVPQRTAAVQTALALLRTAPPEEAPAAVPEAAPAAPMPPAKQKTKPSLNEPVTKVSGIGLKHSKELARLGVVTVRDLLYHLPRRYVDYSKLKTISQLQLGEETTILGTVMHVAKRKGRNNLTIQEARLSDGTGIVTAVWYSYGPRGPKIQTDWQMYVSGKVSQRLGWLQFESPAFELVEQKHLETGRLVPVYPLTEGISARLMRKVMNNALGVYLGSVQDLLPADLRSGFELPPLNWAIQQIHFPVTWDSLTAARNRLAFDELLLLEIGLLQRRRAAKAAPAAALPVPDGWAEQFQQALPFSLTGAQVRCLKEILQDMAQLQPMARLLQGDVGSGKTAVALGAMLAAIANGKQAALMVPTQILAEQHFRNISKLLGKNLEDSSAASNMNEPEKVQNGLFAAAQPVLLTGNMNEKEKEQVLQALASGEANIVIGTQALIQEKVIFQDLGLVVVDEQHRFGVMQRSALTGKGNNPHLLAMSGTPIPRTMALVVFGDMDLSVIDEMPPGRQRIITRQRTDRDREKIYQFIEKEAEEKRQTFVICPVIEGSESEDSDMKAATEEYEHLRKVIFPNLRIGLLHGKMPEAEKETAMRAFANGDYDVLVSTSVVEVGIDIPNATVMMIEGADRFGLAQLHQFRGRVGRGKQQSYCILMSSTDNEISKQRLQAVEEESNGFRLAEIDLTLRGPGEFFGMRQSGMPDLRAAKLSDLETLAQARRAAEQILDQDPDLTYTEHQALAQTLQQFWQSSEPSV